MVNLEPIQEADYLEWRARNERSYADDLVKAGNRDPEGAAEKAHHDFEEALPQGMHSPNQWIYSIIDESGEKVGVIWYQFQERPPFKEAFILDLEIMPEYRRRGYAQQAMLAVEAEARERGMNRMALHVFGQNTGAIRLYEKLGYQATNINMAKDIR